MSTPSVGACGFPAERGYCDGEHVLAGLNVDGTMVRFECDQCDAETVVSIERAHRVDGVDAATLRELVDGHGVATAGSGGEA